MNLIGRTAETDEPIELNMTSMIDCVFLLLIFFVMTMEFPATEGNLPAHLPKKGVSKRKKEEKKKPPRDILINLRYPNNRLAILLEGADLGGRMDFLQSKLYRLRHSAGDANVVIDAAGDVPYEYVVHTLNTCAAVGYAKVRFAEHEENT